MYNHRFVREDPRSPTSCNTTTRAGKETVVKIREADESTAAVKTEILLKTMTLDWSSCMRTRPSAQCDRKKVFAKLKQDKAKKDFKSFLKVFQKSLKK